MTIEEFSNGMDTLINAYSNTGFYGENHPLELDEYEKSVFLTHAQETIVKRLYSLDIPNTPSFESTEERRRQLDTLVFQKDYSQEGRVIQKLDDNKFIHTVYNLPCNCWYIVFEQVTLSTDNTCTDGSIAMVVPVSHDTYQRIRNNPYKGPNNRKALRLDSGLREVEIVSTENIGTYTLRYLSKPEPIILIDLPSDLSIDGIHTSNPCKLPQVVHRAILEEAVKEALASRGLNTANQSK